MFDLLRLWIIEGEIQDFKNTLKSLACWVIRSINGKVPVLKHTVLLWKIKKHVDLFFLFTIFNFYPKVCKAFCTKYLSIMSKTNFVVISFFISLLLLSVCWGIICAKLETKILRLYSYVISHFSKALHSLSRKCFVNIMESVV